MLTNEQLQAFVRQGTKVIGPAAGLCSRRAAVLARDEVQTLEEGGALAVGELVAVSAPGVAPGSGGVAAPALGRD